VDPGFRRDADLLCVLRASVVIISPKRRQAMAYGDLTNLTDVRAWLLSS
jgi:hypothetical protein